MIIIGVIGISLSAIFVRLSEAPSAVTASWRLVWTVVLMTPVTLGKKDPRTELAHTDWKTALLCCVSGIFLAIHFLLWFESLSHTSVASSTSIVCTEVIWVSLGYCIFMKGKLSKWAVLCIATAFIGSVLIAFSDSASGENMLYGDILSLLSAVAVAVYMLLGRVAREKLSTTVYTYIVYVSCAVMLVAVTLIQGASMVEYGYRVVITGLLLAVFSTILGHSIFSWCLKYFSPSFVSASKLCEPVVAAIIAGFLFQEVPTLLQILGGVIVIASVFFFSRVEKNNA